MTNLTNDIAKKAKENRRARCGQKAIEAFIWTLEWLCSFIPPTALVISDKLREIIQIRLMANVMGFKLFNLICYCCRCCCCGSHVKKMPIICACVQWLDSNQYPASTSKWFILYTIYICVRCACRVCTH